MSPSTASAAANHATWALSYQDRAVLPGTSPLAAYLLRLMALKQTNLCVSADVTTTSELLTLADEVGDQICLLKTHCDILSDFGERTVRGLTSLARKKRFLIFEDRKFADIGETVRKQYTGGPFRIARWAEITNAHILPGPAIITGLKEGADAAIAAIHATVSTEISSIPREPGSADDSDAEPSVDTITIEPGYDDSEHAIVSPGSPLSPLASPRSPYANTNPLESDRLGASGSGSSPANNDRKLSVVSISTTISTRTESISLHPRRHISETGPADDPLSQLSDPPLGRALLLLAEMSSKGHLLTGAYTEQCITLAREHKGFVMGFIAQRSLNVAEGDNFITMTPGCQLPPASAQEGGKMGDSLGQQYNTPQKLIGEQGSDVVIVGRGIYKADHPELEAERYRREAWEAYEQRTRKRV